MGALSKKLLAAISLASLFQTVNHCTHGVVFWNQCGVISRTAGDLYEKSSPFAFSNDGSLPLRRGKPDESYRELVDLTTH